MHMMKALDANESSKYFSKAGTFSGVGANGITDGRSGVAVRLIQGVVDPSVQQGVTVFVVCAVDVGRPGKVFGITFRSIRAFSDR